MVPSAKKSLNSFQSVANFRQKYVWPWNASFFRVNFEMNFTQPSLAWLAHLWRWQLPLSWRLCTLVQWVGLREWSETTKSDNISTGTWSQWHSCYECFVVDCWFTVAITSLLLFSRQKTRQNRNEQETGGAEEGRRAGQSSAPFRSRTSWWRSEITSTGLFEALNWLTFEWKKLLYSVSDKDNLPSGESVMCVCPSASHALLSWTEATVELFTRWLLFLTATEANGDFQMDFKHPQIAWHFSVVLSPKMHQLSNVMILSCHWIICESYCPDMNVNWIECTRKKKNSSWHR